MGCCFEKKILGLSTAKEKANEYFILFNERIVVIEKSKGSYMCEKYEDLQGGVETFYDTNVLE